MAFYSRLRHGRDRLPALRSDRESSAATRRERRPRPPPVINDDSDE